MFERFTDRARRATVLAQEEARLLNHNYIGTEHILLGLIHGDGLAASALGSLGVSLEVARSSVEEIIGLGGASPSGHIPFTPRARKVLELSLSEALQLGHNYIAPEHILLALVREGDGVGVKVLDKFGIDEHDVRKKVIELLSKIVAESVRPSPVVADDDPVVVQEWAFIVPTGDPEVQVMSVALEALTSRDLSPETQRRIILWLADRFDVES